MLIDWKSQRNVLLSFLFFFPLHIPVILIFCTLKAQKHVSPLFENFVRSWKRLPGAPAHIKLAIAEGGGMKSGCTSRIHWWAIRRADPTQSQFGTELLYQSCNGHPRQHDLQLLSLYLSKTFPLNNVLALLSTVLVFHRIELASIRLFETYSLFNSASQEDCPKLDSRNSSLYKSDSLIMHILLMFGFGSRVVLFSHNPWKLSAFSV